MAISFSGWQSAVDAERKGAETAQNFFENMRKARAYNALRSQYGDQVGNLDWTQAQSAYGAQQKLPGELEAQRLGNEGTAIKNDYARENNPLLLEQQRQSNLTARQDYDFNAQANPLKLEATRSNLDTARMNRVKTETAMGDDAAERSRTAVVGAVAAIEEAVANGEDAIAAFDRIVPQVAAQENVKPEEVARLRQQFAANPKGFMAAVKSSIAASRPDYEAKKVANAEKRLEIERQRVAAKADAKGGGITEQAIATQEAQNAHVNNTIAETEALSRRVATSNFGRGLNNLVAKATGGTGLTADETAYMANIDSLVAGLGLDALTRLKVDKSTSLGQVTEAEHKLLQASTTRLKAARSPAAVREELANIRKYYARYQSALTRYMESRPGGAEAYARYRQGDAPSAPAAAAPNAALEDALKLYGGGR